MTDKLLRVAVFEPVETNAAQIQKLFTNKSRFDVKYVRKPSEIVAAIDKGGAPFDAIVVPSLLADRLPSATACLQVKSEEALSAIPLLVLSWIKDTPAIASLYGAGADVVCNAPFEAELVFKQLASLHRLTLAFGQDQIESSKDKGLRQALVSALHFIEDSIVIFDAQPRVVFANKAARDMLRVYSADDGGEIERALSGITSIVARELDLEDSDKAKSLESVMSRTDGTYFSAEIRLMPLRNSDGSVVAYCASIYDLTAPKELSSNLMQIERLNSLALLLAASCHQLLKAVSLGEPGKPLSQLESLLRGQKESAGLVPVGTAVLEFLDLVLSQRSSLKVDLNKDFSIAMKAADLFQLIGHLVLYAARFAGYSGETRVKSQESDRPGYVSLLVSALADQEQLSTQEKQTAAAVRTKIFGLDRQGSERLTTSISFGIAVAQDIARAYALKIKEERKSNYELQLMIELPLVIR